MSRHFHTIGNPTKTLRTYLNIKNGRYKKYQRSYVGDNYNRFFLLNERHVDSALIFEYRTNDVIHFHLKSGEYHKITESIYLNVCGSFVLKMDANHNLSVYNIDSPTDGLLSASGHLGDFKLDHDAHPLDSSIHDGKILIVCTDYCYLIKGDLITKFYPTIGYNAGYFFEGLIFIDDYYGDMFQLYDMNGCPLSHAKKDFHVLDNYENRLLVINGQRSSLGFLYLDSESVKINLIDIKVTDYYTTSRITDQYLVVQEIDNVRVYLLKYSKLDTYNVEKVELLWKINSLPFSTDHFNGALFLRDTSDDDKYIYDIYDFS